MERFYRGRGAGKLFEVGSSGVVQLMSLASGLVRGLGNADHDLADLLV